MLRRFWLVSIVALLVLPAFAQAQFKQGDWAVTFTADGTAQKDLDTFDASLTSGPEYFLTDQISIGLKNTLSLADGGSNRNGAIRAFGFWNFDLGRWVPYIGANIGYAYGDSINDDFIAGPEGGVRYFVNSTTYIQANLAYEFNLNEGFDEGAWFYGLGIGFKF